MKFGKTLASTADADWAKAGMFIDYHRLKVQIRKMIALNQADAASATSAGTASSSSASPDVPSPPTPSMLAFAKAYDLFWCILKSEIDKVSEFYCARESEALAHCAALRLDDWTLPSSLADPHTVAAFLRVYDEVHATSNASSSSPSSAYSDAAASSSSSSAPSASADMDMATVASPILPPVPFLASPAANELLAGKAMTTVVSPRLSSASPPFAGIQMSSSTNSNSLNHSQSLRDTEATREFRSFFALCAAIDRLRKYSAMNYMAVIKIVKKLGAE